MPRKNSAKSAAAPAVTEVVDEPVVNEVVDASADSVSSSVSSTMEESDVQASATESGANIDESAVGGKSSNNQRNRLTIVQKLDRAIKMIEDGSPTGSIIKILVSIRKTLDGAHIKSSKKTRKPNQYNLFMSEQMEKLKEVSDIPATEKFKMCIKMWNERKVVDANAA